MKAFDVMVIGAGSAGRYAAKVAAREGASVGLVEAGPFGGLCILNGCMPTKAYLRSSELVGLIRKGPEIGVVPGGRTQIRFDRIKSRKDRLIKEMAEDAKSGIVDHPAITLLSGSARFLSMREIQVGPSTYACEKYVIASGSKMVVPSFPGLKETGFLNSDDALAMNLLPASMVVIGGGAEALEFGQFFHRMGVQTTILQRSGHLLSREDPDIGMTLAEIFRKDGIDVRCGTQIKRVKSSEGLKQIYFKQAQETICVEGEEILLVTGRTGNVERLHLNTAGVETNEYGIEVNEYLQTSNPNIYAAGDVTGIDLIVNIATYQGKIAGANIMKGPMQKADYRVIPKAIFTDPQYARVGLSEREAEQRGVPIRVGRFPFNDLGKAIVTDQMDGFVKILASPENGEILGVQIVGAGASDLIHQTVIAMRYRTTLKSYAEISHIHPSMSEILLYLVEDMIDAV
ncbi:MAG: dihydrolipoyl dehydrogenase family protein [Nitrospiria bacterium]